MLHSNLQVNNALTGLSFVKPKVGVIRRAKSLKRTQLLVRNSILRNESSVGRSLSTKNVNKGGGQVVRQQGQQGDISGWWGKLLYKYYNWRKGSWSDLQLFLLINSGLIILGGLMRRALVNPSGSQIQLPELWEDVYEIIVLTVGQEFPADTEQVSYQVFSVIVAVLGLAIFALVLALAEQVVLEMLENNVRKGSKVYEQGHVLLLGWGSSQNDIEGIQKVISELCLAHRKDTDGKTIVVLCEREKLEMEAYFQEIFPEASRHGCELVFRKGNPLIPENLQMVAADEADFIIIVSDLSRSAKEADAQSIRVAVLLDEIIYENLNNKTNNNENNTNKQNTYGKQKSQIPNCKVIVELRECRSSQLVRYACSDKILPVDTAQLKARRISRLICQPVATVITSRVFDFSSDSQLYVTQYPELYGKKFKDLKFYFPDAVVVGVLEKKKSIINPQLSHEIKPGSHIILFRSTAFGVSGYRPLKEPLVIEETPWTPSPIGNGGSKDEIAIEDCGCKARASLSGGDIMAGISGRHELRGTRCSPSGHYMLPIEYTEGWREDSKPQRVLICCWAEFNYMSNMIRELDHGNWALPRGSEVTLFNNHSTTETLDLLLQTVKLTNISVHHVQGDPLCSLSLETIDMSGYKTALVLCDESWQDPDNDISNGIQFGERRDMLRLDSLVMMVQLNIRKQLEESQHPDINVICWKMAHEGVTRFEDEYRLPMGISFNNSSYAANMLAQVGFNPNILPVVIQFGDNVEMQVIDSSVIASWGENLSFWDISMRASRMGLVLIGYYEIPVKIEDPLKIQLNPMGNEIRSQRKVWNQANGRIKLLTIRHKNAEEMKLQLANQQTILLEDSMSSTELRKIRAGYATRENVNGFTLQNVNDDRE